MKAWDRLTEFLHDRYGLVADQLNSAAVRQVADDRRQIHGLSEDSYLSLLIHSAEESETLIEALIVPETYFLRYSESFRALVEWAGRRTRRPLRVLSLACSTGEEPYSIAISLAEAGWTPGEIAVEARDISPASLAIARRGIYGAKSFRGPSLRWRKAHFDEVSEGWQIRRTYQDQITFRVANLLDLSDSGGWDAIFCRNVLIYFSPVQQLRVMENLRKALADDGLLFLGSAEPPTFLERGWKMSGFPMSFACVKTDKPEALPAAAPKRTLPRPVTRPKITPFVKNVAPATAAPPRQEDPMQAASRLADEGKLDEAESVLASLHGAQAEFLKGIIAQAKGRDDLAETHYRKAVFHDPAHAQALRHMALLLASQGRVRAAETLNRRAARHETP